MENYKHMRYSTGAVRIPGPRIDQSYPIAMVFRMAGAAVIAMHEMRWEAMRFPTDADATDFAAAQCRSAIDACNSGDFAWPECVAGSVATGAT